MIPAGLQATTLTGKFLTTTGKPIANFILVVDASLEQIDTDQGLIDLGRQNFVLNKNGELIRYGEPTALPQVISNQFPDQPFHYKASVTGYDLARTEFAFEAPPGGIVDIPQAIRDVVDPDELPEWIAVRNEIREIRDEVRRLAESMGNEAAIEAAVTEYLQANPLIGVTQQVLEAELREHIENETPHPTYDEIPDLTLIFENRLV